MAMSERLMQVLKVVVETFISTAKPVGSGAIARVYRPRLSSASIRNAMAALEELGLLEQPHTSAGRVPTARAFRIYVDEMLQPHGPTARERDLISDSAQRSRPDMQSVLRGLSRTLASMTPYAGLAVAPSSLSSAVRRLAFVPGGRRRIIAVFAGELGVLAQRAVDLDFEVGAAELQTIENYLNEMLEGLTLEQIRERLSDELEQERSRCDVWVHRSLVIGQRSLPDRLAAGRSASSLIVEGSVNVMVHPEFADLEALERFLRTVDEKSRLVRLLDRLLSDQSAAVCIGPEFLLPEVQGCTLVAARVAAGGRVGSVGVLGPIRMDYARVVPLVRFAAGVVGQAMEEIS